MSVLATMHVNIHDFEGTSSQAWQTGCMLSAEGATARSPLRSTQRSGRAGRSKLGCDEILIASGWLLI